MQDLGAGPSEQCFMTSSCSVNRACYDLFEKMAYMQGYHTVLTSKICPYFAVLRLRKHECPYF